MQLVILANQLLKEELLTNVMDPEIDLAWIESPDDFCEYSGADAFLDLLFENTPQRIELLSGLAGSVIINSVSTTLRKINKPFVRINAWPGFLKRAVVEASSNSEKKESRVEKVFSFLNRTIEWVEDEPGFITARIIATIINEAYFALQEKISTKEEIDTAMKLGTNYPYGPFEWARKIGVGSVYMLLVELSKINPRYNPALLLEKEATK